MSTSDENDQLFFLLSNVGNKPLALSDIEIEINTPHGTPVIKYPRLPVIIQPNTIKDFSFKIQNLTEECGGSYTVVVIFSVCSLKGKSYDLYKHIEMHSEDVKNKKDNYSPFKLKKGGSWIKERWGI